MVLSALIWLAWYKKTSAEMILFMSFNIEI